MGSFFLFILGEKITEHKQSNETHVVCKNGILLLLNVHNKIKSICIWPSASKAYVYKKNIWNAKC